MARKKSAKTNVFQLQQGDVYFERVDSIPTEATHKTADNGIAKVFAYGEATGHCHQPDVADSVELYELDGVMYVRVKADVNVVHEEHRAVQLPAGDYRYGQVVEYDYLNEMNRAVQD